MVVGLALCEVSNSSNLLLPHLPHLSQESTILAPIIGIRFSTHIVPGFVNMVYEVVVGAELV